MNLISMERVSESCALDSKSLISDDGNADFSGIKALGQHLAQKAQALFETWGFVLGVQCLTDVPDVFSVVLLLCSYFVCDDGHVANTFSM